MTTIKIFGRGVKEDFQKILQQLYPNRCLCLIRDKVIHRIQIKEEYISTDSLIDIAILIKKNLLNDTFVIIDNEKIKALIYNDNIQLYSKQKNKEVL